jgi:2-polyprenyl-6-methoxyphenol hydroxylase-like FAD-dependent oxidoreductase
MLGYLLARRGINVTVLEKHKDFNRDFRGDTVHPSTLQVLHDLGLLDDFLKVPHQKVTSAGGLIGDAALTFADFQHVPARCRFVALMPQWDFLNFLSQRAKEFPNFDLRMEHEVTDLLRKGDRITGVLARDPEQRDLQIRADLVVGCDGRHAITRQAGRLELLEFGVPIDVLWFRLTRKPNDPEQVLGNINHGKALILIDRGDYFQAGLIIRKGSYDEIRQRGLDDFRRSILLAAPYLYDRVEELQDWDQVKILTVQINRLRSWYREGLLCIGDSAHAMSPAGGVGINLAIQDAVAAANLLRRPLLEGRVTEAVLASVQRRREFPTRVTQAIQLVAHRGLAKIFDNPGPIKAPWQLKFALGVPGVNRALGYAIGIGARPERPDIGVRRPKRSLLALTLGVAVGVAVTIMTVRRIRQIQARNRANLAEKRVGSAF